jgi:predicted nucleic acid-binding protein
LSLFIDTSVWSLALRRDSPGAAPEVAVLAAALDRGDVVVSTGLVLQELLQGFSGPRARGAILDRFTALAFLMPTREDHVLAAALRTTCRQHGVQVGTVDALLAQLCIANDMTILTTDRDFAHMAEHVPLRVWGAGSR